MKRILAILMLVTVNVTAAPPGSLAYAEQLAEEAHSVSSTLSGIEAVEQDSGSITVGGVLEQGNKNLIRSIMIEGVDIATKVAEKYPTIPNCMFVIIAPNGDLIAGIGAYNYGDSSASPAVGQRTAEEWLNEGRALFDQGRYEEALLAYEEAIWLDPENADAWNGKGTILNVLGRLDEARDANQQAFNIRKGTSTTIPLRPAIPRGSRENPMPRGTWVHLGDGWSINVCCVIPDATRAVLNENMFNDPPKAGHQFFLAKLTACYKGSGCDKFGGAYRLRAVGASNVAYSTFENGCGVIPEELPDPEVFSGGCVEGYVGWEIKSSDADSLVMYDSPLFGSSGERIYFKLLP